jgi:hypothetical protein
LLLLRSNVSVEFDAQRKCFVDIASGTMKRGLTKILAQLVPVPFDKLDSDELAAIEARTRRPRRSRNDPAPEPLIANYAGETMARCSTCKRAREWLAQASGGSGIAERLSAEPHADKAHGIIVDYQLQMYVRAGSRAAFFQSCAVVDPCVGTLIEHFDARGWAIVATQMPLYASAMDVATAFDVVATDRATRQQIILCEVKATRGGQTVDELTRNNLQYERLRGRLQRTTLRGVPLSYYSRHQLQLFCMLEMVRLQHGFTFDSAVILRLSPGVVRQYDLNDYYRDRSAQIVRAIALKTGRLSGRKRSAPAPK